MYVCIIIIIIIRLLLSITLVICLTYAHVWTLQQTVAVATQIGQHK